MKTALLVAAVALTPVPNTVQECFLPETGQFFRTETQAGFQMESCDGQTHEWYLPNQGEAI